MAETRVQRRLAAILVVDIAGCSWLFERDEAGTLAAPPRQRQAARSRDFQDVP